MKEAKKGTRRVLQVKRGIVVPPVVLQAMLPDVASVVKNAMTAGSSKQTSQPNGQPQDTTCKPRNQKKILNSFPCNICRSWFPTRLALNEHSLSHDYECRTCKIPFISERLLLKHSCCICKACNKPSARGNHNGCRRVFTCKCGEQFTHNRDFKAHQKIHVEIYGHCLMCGRQFTNETDLVNHVTKMKFPCIYCGACFSDSDELSEHNEPPPEPKYSCKICRETFEDSFAAASHSRWHGAPMRSYSRKPKAAAQSTNAKELANGVVKKVNLYEIPIEFDKETDGKGGVKNDGGRWFFKIEEEPRDKLDGDLEERVPGAELKLECVKVEYEDEEMRELNRKTLDIGSSKHHADAIRKKTTCEREPALTNPLCAVEPSWVKPEPAETPIESETFDTHPWVASLKRECI